MNYTPQTASDLAAKTCKACEQGTAPLSDDEVRSQIAELPGWDYAQGEVSRVFSFKDYYQTMAFVNAVAWIAHQEDHHPDLEVGYNKCRVRFSTHSVGGISENDLICAAKVNELI